jgi:hypothetical protein
MACDVLIMDRATAAGRPGDEELFSCCEPEALILCDPAYRDEEEGFPGYGGVFFRGEQRDGFASRTFSDSVRHGGKT